MSLFGITLKKIEAIPGDLVHDVFGGGNNNQNKTSAPQNNGVYQTQAQQAAAAVHPPTVAQPAATNPAINTPPPASPVKKKDAFHNPVTDFLGNDIVKPMAAPVIQFGKEVGAVPEAIGREVQDKPITDIQQKTFGTTDPGKIAEKIIGSTVGTGLTVAAPGVDSALTDVASKVAPEAARFVGAGATGAGFGASSAASEGGNAKQVLEGAGMGAAGGTAVPLISSVGREILGRFANPTEGKNPLVEPTQAEQATNPTPATSRSNVQTTTKPISTGSLVIPKGTPRATAQAAMKLAGLYEKGVAPQENGTLRSAGERLIQSIIGKTAMFSNAGDSLEKAMEGDLTPEERIAVRDNLEGAALPGEVTPKVQAVTDVMRQLNEHGYNTLENASSAEDPLYRVQRYATRLSTGAPSVEGQPNPVESIKDLFDVNSRFSQHRAVGKFVNSKGEVRYGIKSDMPKSFKPVAVSTRELNENSPFNYENDYGKIANAYHSSVGRVKAAQDVLAEFKANPEKYGLSTEPGKGLVPIQKGDLAGYFAPKDVATKAEDLLGYAKQPSLPERAWQGVLTGVIQPIVYNALFHTRNLMELAGLAGGRAFGAAGPALVKKGIGEYLLMDGDAKQALVDKYLADNGHFERYGADRQTVLSNAFDKLDLPHVNKTFPAIMGKADATVRMGLYHTLTSGGVDGKEAADMIDHFLGDQGSAGPLARNIGLFWHYMKTRLGVVKEALQHPEQNSGVFIAAAEQAAVLYGATRAFQQWTGNKHGSLGHPGLFGLVKNVEDIAHGRGAATATSLINPVVTAIANQAYGKDLYTGDTLNSKSDRIRNAEETLFAPAQQIEKVQGGKSTPAQQGLYAATGISLPHVKGAPAVPNKGNPLAVINAKDAKAVADEKNAQGKVVVHDPTGLDQATLYYNARNKALAATSGNPEAQDAVKLYLDNNTGPKGVKIRKSPDQAIGAAAAVAGSPEALDALKQMERSQPSHDPMWDLSDKDLKLFLQSQLNPDVASADKIIFTKFNNGEGFQKFDDRRNAYYTNNKFQGSSQPNPESPTYPTFKGQQQADYNTYEKQFKNSTDGKAKAAFIQSHPLVADALQQINKYYSDLSFARYGVRPKDSLQLTPLQQSWYNWYNALPKGTGARSQAIKSNQAMWNSITKALGEADLVSLAKEGAVDQYQGVPFSQKFLKDAYDAGKYDIVPNAPLPGGGTGFAFNPSAAYSSGSGHSKSSKSSSTSKFIAKSKAMSQARDAERAAKAANRAVYKAQKSAKLHGPRRLSVHMRGELRVKPYKVKGATLKTRRVGKLSLKPAKTLSSRSHVKLKT